MNVSTERQYVIVCNRHKPLISGGLLFWGKITDDNAERRSFVGYTSQIDLCERYTREELEVWRGECGKINFPFFDELPTTNNIIDARKNLKKPMDVFVTIGDLHRMGYSAVTIMAVL